MAPSGFTETDFERFRDLVYAKTGIHFESSKRAYLEKRIMDRLQSTQDSTLNHYLMRLRYEASGAELQELVNAVTVNETYFFREDYQLHCLANSMLPETVRLGRRNKLRIWSLPCSTGEEAYSIALTLLEEFKDVDSLDIEIMGSDIDTKVLETAQAGIFHARSLQYVSAAIRQKYFTRRDDDRWQICEGLRDSVSFNKVNIMDRLGMLKHGAFDVIFCRNLLIYFDDASRRQAVENIFEALFPLGFICLGHSESMSRISGIFNVRKFAEAIVYQRPA